MSNEYDTAEYDEVDENPGERGKWVSAIIGLAGVWLLIESVWFELLAANFWNDVVVGVLLVALGGYNYYRRSNDELASTAAAAVSALLGLWLVVSPWVYGVDVGTFEVATAAGFWNDVIVGLVVLVAGAYSVYESRDRDVAVATSR